ncbi:follicular epithelium yolk protein subunit [Rhodovulum sp. MB263]|uniref:follicular epithelium yolk protein subunit n=1 Tax=Rhodovulum sp. (strain MB263) TaxID=308754 RepID=UPI0009B7B7D5|nr:follicular epithelium yolk protein subunit [Rhodovulum sp. MB263]ARC90494.1 follicular epithelium yolk protein subunit [Rhodovulum sp. MB263]
MGIDVTINAGPDEHTSSVTATGSIQHVITDEERTTFKIGDAALKTAVEKYFGKKPNDAYVRSPTPWNDLYQSYSWPQVQTVLVPVRSEILGITSQPVIVKEQTFENNSQVTGTFNVGISDEVSNSATSSWSTGGTLSVSEEIKVKVGFLGTGAESKTTLSYSQSWGVGGSHSTTTTVGSTAGVSVELAPGQAIIARLTASRGVMKVRISYDAYLIGSVAVNYNPTFNGHHFYGLPVGNVMSAGGISNSVKSTENLEIGYYSNSKVELVDPKSGSVKFSYDLVNVTTGPLAVSLA